MAPARLKTRGKKKSSVRTAVQGDFIARPPEKGLESMVCNNTARRDLKMAESTDPLQKEKRKETPHSAASAVIGERREAFQAGYTPESTQIPIPTPIPTTTFISTDGAKRYEMS